MFRKVLVANRGTAAIRIIRALDALGIAAVAVYSDADRDLPYLVRASEAHPIGPGPARESYLDQEKLLEIARRSGADAVHPGYGFLAENAAFARRVRDAGLAFIGPSPRLIETMGEKTRARALVAREGMPLAQGSAMLGEDATAAEHAASEIGYPVLIKPAAGGGGIGMIAARDRAELQKGLDRARSVALRSFGRAEVYLEKLIDRPRHIEIQILADQYGAVRHLFERDCSLQRRHQKIVEEAVAPGIARAEIEAIAARTVAVLQALGYDNIGTVELLRGADGAFSFLEVNTRLQVEHAVTEMLLGIDLVVAQIRAAAGEHLHTILPATLTPRGHAIEARVYAEDPKTFFPSPGFLTRFRPPAESQHLRVDTGYAEGCTVTPFYDPMLAKVIAFAPDRRAAITRLADALSAFEIEGPKSNIAFLLRALADERFRAGALDTGLAAEISRSS
ncbi:MAG: ATP-grasp domain-containing protein [Acetobacteraceae bacterium]|nr:ATP-grasp domain-containing protein [Acetobacteraceae bacterium]